MKNFSFTMFAVQLPKLLLALSLAYPLFVFSFFPQWLIDDALIHFRYAENLAFRGELTWNVGEDPVEGYTGVLWPVLLAGAAKAGLPLADSARAIGIASFFASWLLLFLILRRLGIRKGVRAAVLLLFSTMPVLFTHATSGLETMLFLSAVLLSVYAFLAATAEGEGVKRRRAFFFLSLLLVSFIRPEGVALAAALAVAAGYGVFRRRPSEFRSFLIHFFCFYFAPALAYFFWRYSYYGALLPNTFYVKATGLFYDTNLVVAQRFLRKFFAVPVLLSLLLLAPEIDLLWMRVKKGELPLSPRTGLLALALAGFAAAIAYEISFSHLLTDFSGRFYLPLFPLFWIGFAALWHLGFSAIADADFRQEKPVRYRFLLLVFSALIAYQTAFNAVKLREEMRFASEEKTMKESQHFAAGEFLREALPPDEWLVVYLDAGAAPYFSRLPTVDFGGLSDEFLARGDPTLQQKIDYFFSKNPGAIFITSESLEKIDYGEEIDAIARDPRFGNYMLYKKYPSPVPYIPSHQFLYLRKDLAAALTER